MKSVEKGINKYKKGKIIMNVEELLEEAWKAVQDEKIKDAVIYLETILEIDRYNLEAFLMLIRIYLRMENYELAMEYCEEAYEKFDKNLDVIFSMGLLYQSIGKNKKASFYYKEFLEIEKNYHVLLNLGICYTELNFWKKALETIDEAIKLEPEKSEGYMAKAEYLAEKGDYKGALEIYEDRVKAEDNNVEEYYLYMRMGDVMARAGKIDEAIHYYNISINYEDTPDYIFENFYSLLISEKRYDEIELLIVNYKNSSDGRKKYLDIEGRFSLEIKDFKRAERVCEKLIMLSPENPRGYFNYAYVMELQHKYDEALDYIYKASNYTDDVEKIKAARNRIMSLKRRYGRLKKAEEKRKKEAMEKEKENNLKLEQDEETSVADVLFEGKRRS